jgi:hypothetical protein
MDKSLILILIALLFIMFFWKGAEADGYDAVGDQKQSVHPDIIQVIIEKIQKAKPDEYPLETLFINKTGTDSYSARFMFMNTQGYFGTQYDVQAKVYEDGTVNVVNMTDTAQIDKFDAGFTGFRPDTYQKYEDINANLDSQLKSAIENYRAQQQPETEPTVMTQKSIGAFEKNIQNDSLMREFMAKQKQAEGPSQGSVQAGASPARSGAIVAYGAPVFNSA